MDKIDGRDVIYTDQGTPIFPISIGAQSPEAAIDIAAETQQIIDKIYSLGNAYPLIITEDRWNSQEQMMRSRLLAHLQVYVQIYARNCEVHKIDKATAAKFLSANHSYGDAACRHRYGLFLKRYTGHTVNADQDRPQPGDLVAVATFSNGRKWTKGDKTIRSYEWTRYASLPGIRLSGGMGRLMQAFIADVKPDDIMTYADLEWSLGEVYEALGFEFEGTKGPVMFAIDCNTWQRKAHIGSDVTDCSRPGQNLCFASDSINTMNSKHLFFQNFGSNKYRLKLTDYQ